MEKEGEKLSTPWEEAGSLSHTHNPSATLLKTPSLGERQELFYQSILQIQDSLAAQKKGGRNIQKILPQKPRHTRPIWD